ncbi:MAG: DUF4349 domain-containing protein [Planctomycetes bacterium]|nr:DUF4349 domain-containing protein [Planctomycetota bacterium]
MMNETDEQLERRLASLTEWSGASPNLWRQALSDSTRRSESHAARRPIINWRSRGFILSSAAVFVLLVGGYIGIQSSPHAFLSKRASSLPMPSTDNVESLAARPFSDWDGNGVPDSGADMLGEESGVLASGATPWHFSVLSTGGNEDDSPNATEPSASLFRASERHVVRKATIELTTDDVRAAFLKAAMLVSAARGEYVQDSGLTGSGETAKANLTLRVAAERLSEVLNQLREFGKVRSERTEGEDVTTQVVDLEARLRNEKRIEDELLDLMERRDNAPLKEILELRDKLGQVRRSIEQMTAQRERLSRLVSLATVLVLIRAEGAPPPVRPGIGAYFGDSISNAWSKGLTFLADTVAGLLSVLIGGIIWWSLLIAIVLIALRRIARRHATPALETEPRP